MPPRKGTSRLLVKKEVVARLDPSEACGLLENLNVLDVYYKGPTSRDSLVHFDCFRDKLMRILDELGVV
jgi:hypothetical protein